MCQYTISFLSNLALVMHRSITYYCVLLALNNAYLNVQFFHVMEFELLLF